jgi:hypothetical protein
MRKERPEDEEEKEEDEEEEEGDESCRDLTATRLGYIITTESTFVLLLRGRPLLNVGVPLPTYAHDTMP